MVLFSASGQGMEIRMEVLRIGQDLAILLSGGDVPHIGTVTSWSADEQKLTSLQFPSHSGRYHKDHILAETLVEIIKSDVTGNIVITSGVHVNGIRPEQIRESFRLTEQLGIEMKEWLYSNPVTFQEPIYKKSSSQ